MKSTILPSRKFGLATAAFATALGALLVVRSREGTPLHEFPREDLPDGAPRYSIQLNVPANGGLAEYPGRDYDYHTGEPVLVTVFLKPAAGSKIVQFGVSGALKEASRRVIQRTGRDRKPIVQLDLRLQCMELEKSWRSDIEVEYERDGQKKVLRVPIEVSTSETYHGEIHSGHPDDAPLIKCSAVPAMLTSLGLLTGGLVCLCIGVRLLLGKGVPGLTPAPPTPQEEQWLAIEATAREHLAHIRAADRSPERCEELAALLRQRFSMPSFNLRALSAGAVRMRESELLTGGALSQALAVCDKAVSTDQEPDANEVAQLAQAIERLFGAHAAKKAKRRYFWLGLLAGMLWLGLAAILWPGKWIFRRLVRRRVKRVRMPKAKPSSAPPAQGVVAVMETVNEHLAAIEAGDGSRHRCQALDSALTQWFELGSLSERGIQFRESLGHYGTGGALAQAIAICRHSVIDASQARQLRAALEKVFGSGLAQCAAPQTVTTTASTGTRVSSHRSTGPASTRHTI